MIELPLAPASAARLLLAYLRTTGGAGSGNFAHSGRPGEVGGSSGEYVYHGTDNSNLNSIREQGLQPNEYGNPLNFHHIESSAAYYGQSVLRVKKSDLPKNTTHDPMTSRSWTLDRVPPQYIEIEQNGVWRHLGGAGSGNFGHSGRPGEVGGSSTETVRVIGSADARRAVKASLDKLPASIRKESTVKEIRAFNNPAVAADKIDEYTQRNYGFMASESAKGLVDRERGVIYTLTNPHETYQQFAHTLADRIRSPEWQNVVRNQPTPQAKEDAFTHFFANTFTDIVELGDPTSAMLRVFNRWGWK